MAIDLKDLYDQAFEVHRHASDYRAKIIGGWAAMCTALAGVFVWVRANRKDLTLIVLLATAAMTLMWLADRRNRPAIGRAKEIGRHIEENPALGIPGRMPLLWTARERRFAQHNHRYLCLGLVRHSCRCRLRYVSASTAVQISALTAGRGGEAVAAGQRLSPLIRWIGFHEEPIQPQETQPNESMQHLFAGVEAVLAVAPKKSTDRETMSPQDRERVAESLKHRPMQFCIFLKALLGADEMQRMMVQAIKVAKQVP